MKTTPWFTLGVLLGSSLIVCAEPEREHPMHPEGEPTPELIKKFDKDHDGKLSDEEKKEMREAMQSKREQYYKEMLAKYDTDGDGKLSDEEKKAMYKDMEARKAEMLKKYDTNGDGKLSDEERAKMPNFGHGIDGPHRPKLPDGSSHPVNPEHHPVNPEHHRDAPESGGGAVTPKKVQVE